MHDLIADLRYGVRMWKREPGLTLAAVVSIAIGVAANTTVFSVVNRVVFQQLPVGQPETLVVISGQSKDTKRAGDTISWPAYQDLLGEKAVFEGVAAFFPIVPAGLNAESGQSTRMFGQLVTGNYFDVAKVRLALGRGFLPEEDSVPGRDFVVVLSHHLWKTRLGADPNIIGKQIRISQQRYTVAGVAPEGFRGTDVGLIADFWVPMSLQRQILVGLPEDSMNRTSRNHNWLFCIGRLKDGVGEEAAQKAVHALGARLEQAHPDSNKNRTFFLERAGRLSALFRQSVLTFLTLLLVVMSLVLLIACANVANLLLARAARRQREMSTRLAIGAPRGRLIRQLLTESMLLALSGAAVAMLLTSLTQHLIARIELPFPLPIDLSTGIDWRVGLFTLAVTLLTNLTFGLLPSLRATRIDLVSALKVTTTEGFGKGRMRLTSALVTGQVAVAMLLLTGAVLALRSLQNAHTVSLGFDVRNALLVSLDPALDGMSGEQSTQAMRVLYDRVRQLPGVASVSYIDYMQLSLIGQSTSVRDEAGMKADRRSDLSAEFFHVGPDYPKTMGLALLSGTDDLRSAESSTHVPALINQYMAGKLWPGQNPIGRHFDSGGKRHMRVAGVVANSKARSIGEDTRALYYAPFEESAKARSFFGVRLIVRTHGSPLALAPAVRREIQSAYPNLSVFDMQDLQTHLAAAQLLPRIAAVLFGFAGLSALLLAITGLFGVINYSVNRRTREIGIRMALGAERGSVLRMVLMQGMRLSVVGAVIGMAMAFAGTRILSGLLYGVEPTDSFTFTVVPFVLLATAAGACLAPALRASRLLPMAALREE
ncbi:MAG: ABC transporter permease [Bryobacterales bacterium]|nr:ABC transporter permease [Bryobacterales bacterium]